MYNSNYDNVCGGSQTASGPGGPDSIYNEWIPYSHGDSMECPSCKATWFSNDRIHGNTTCPKCARFIATGEIDPIINEILIAFRTKKKAKIDKIARAAAKRGMSVEDYIKSVKIKRAEYDKLRCPGLVGRFVPVNTGE